MINRVERLLSGKPDSLAKEIRREMEAAAAAQRFEEAAVLRDRLLALEHLLKYQQASATGIDSLDVIGLHAQADVANVQVLQIRDGLLSDRRSFFLKNTSGEGEDEILEQFIIQYYTTPIGLPSEIVVPASFSETKTIADFLSGVKGSRVEIKRAVRGHRRRLAAMAAHNAALALKQDILREEEKRARPAKALAELKDVLGLKQQPMRIECYDISNTGGRHPVGSMIVFEAGLPRPGHYRKFAVRTAGPDDFAMIAEVVTRRFSRQLTGETASKRKGNLPPGGTDESFSSRPDLIVVDGGAGQVSAAVAALQSLGLADLPVVGLAKKREEVYIKGNPRPLVLPLDSPALGLLMRARDEAHRFAVSFHRQRRSRELSSSILDELPGIGPARKRAILEHFGSPAKFLAASRDELEAVPGLPAKVAREVYALVHKLG